MTDGGSGQRDDQGEPGSSKVPHPSEDFNPSDSWESSGNSSWENTTPYESAYGESASSAAEPSADPGSWPGYPAQSAPEGGYQPESGPPSEQGSSQPSGPPQTYDQPAGYDPANDPYGQAGSYGSANDPYGQPGNYGQPQEYGQPQGYGQQPAYGVNPYQQPAYGGYVPPNHPQATTALVLGIIGVVLCPFVGIAGFVIGGRVRREIDAAAGQWGSRGVATAGWVLGIISIAYAALLLVYLVILVVVGVASSI